MDKKKVMLSMMREMINMSAEDYIYFCVMLRASSPKELETRIEYMIRAITRIRKIMLRREATRAVYKRRVFLPKPGRHRNNRT